MNVFIGLTVVLAFSLSFDSCAQGGWNIGYMHIDSVGPSYIGKDVKLDFIGKLKISPVNSNHIRTIVSPQDTAKIQINNKDLELVEVRTIYSDWGFYDEQYLECANYSSNQTLRIYHSVIEDLNEDSIKIRLYVEVYRKNKKGKHIDDPKKWCRSLWIEKNKLNGLMIEN
ncbi:MAG: hypothetical protein ACJAUD_000766 [Crocinitomicaceae bacterium]|jgi:hypothetical protein